MPDTMIDLDSLVKKLAKRTASRTEATIQAELHALLLAAPLGLDEGHLHQIVLEQPTGNRRRIDVEVGFCVFEVKRDLRKGNVRSEAEEQLADYVRQRTTGTGQRYVGVLTDGCEWRLYRLRHSALDLVSVVELHADEPNVVELLAWLEGVLATGEHIRPTPVEIERLLGAASVGHKLDMAELAELYESNRTDPTVQTKRRLWAKLLTTAQGAAFRDDEQLFCQHTLLVVAAEIVAHAVLDIDISNVPAIAIVSGQQFRVAKVRGVVEADFFDWVAQVQGGDRLVRSLVRRLMRFAWTDVQHDVLKVLYESVIPAEQRKQLGEYYTPDWLAERVVDEAIQDPLAERVLDPSCGSGTFLFHAVRRYLRAADKLGMANPDTISGACSHVMGVDLHPVAVTLARVTYLLALGRDRLKAKRGPVSIPVFLGDSLQWGQEDTLQTHGALVVYTDDGPQLFPTELRFPDRLLSDAGRFDAFVVELADLACERPRGAPAPMARLSPVFQRYGVSEEDRAVVEQTFRTMCTLHDEGRDHIWGYFVRNVARPRWLAKEANRVDVLLGNPPWLSYRYMTADMQREFRRLAKERDLWTGAKSATHADLSTLFVVRCVERYLRGNGRFGFVLPYAVLSRQHCRGFRSGVWRRAGGKHGAREILAIGADFAAPWDLHAVKPPFFEVPCSVVFGRRTDELGARALPSTVIAWVGRLAERNMSWDEAKDRLQVHAATVGGATTAQPLSPYASRFTQGATLVPRMLALVEVMPAGPLGNVSGEVRVRSRRQAAEKAPWKTLPAIEGTVESQFLLSVHLGDTVLPFRPLDPLHAVIPWDGKKLLFGGEEQLALYAGLHDWWTRAEAVWTAHRRSERLTLIKRWDYQRGLSKQFLPSGICPSLRVVYSKSGMYLAAAIVDDPDAVIDHKLYWAACDTRDEANYLCSVLNSAELTRLVRRFQSRGEHNPRDFDKYVWQLPIPEFDPAEPCHASLAELGAKAAEYVSGLTPPRTRFEKQRRFVREQLAGTSIGSEIEHKVRELLG